MNSSDDLQAVKFVYFMVPQHCPEMFSHHCGGKVGAYLQNYELCDYSRQVMGSAFMSVGMQAGVLCDHVMGLLMERTFIDDLCSSLEPKEHDTYHGTRADTHMYPWDWG